MSATPILRDGAVTYPGMAHFAGTGPSGRKCRDCGHWNGSNVSEFATPRPATCAKAKSLMGGRAQKAVPANALACSFFSGESA